MAEQDFTQDVVGNGEFGEADNTAVKTEIKTEDSSATSEATATNESNGNGIPKGADDNSAEDRKLFVGGLSWETREPQLKSYFEAFGEVETIKLKYNPMTGRYDDQFSFCNFSAAIKSDKIQHFKKSVKTQGAGKKSHLFG